MGQTVGLQADQDGVCVPLPAAQQPRLSCRVFQEEQGGDEGSVCFIDTSHTTITGLLTRTCHAKKRTKQHTGDATGSPNESDLGPAPAKHTAQEQEEDAEKGSTPSGLSTLDTISLLLSRDSFSKIKNLFPKKKKKKKKKS